MNSTNKKAKKVASRKRAKKPVAMAESSVLSEKLLKKHTDEELAIKFAQPVRRVFQARMACGFARIRAYTEQERDLIRKLIVARIPLKYIAEALNRNAGNLSTMIGKDESMPARAKSSGKKPDATEKARINKVLAKHGLA